MIGFSSDKGGVESYISNLSHSLDKTKYEIVYALPEMRIDEKKWVAPLNRHNYIKYYLFWKKFYKENSFDVIYYNTCDIVSVDQLKFAKAANIPVRIIHSHNTNVQFKKKFFHKIMEQRHKKNIRKYATNLLACSETAGNWMFPYDEYKIIKNGIDVNKYKYNSNFRVMCRESIKINDECLIGCVGRLDEQKNPFFSINILKELIKINNNVRLVFIGDGSLRQKLNNEVNKLGLSKYCYILGAKDNVNEWYSAFDCLLMPSLFEGLPFALVEAQASGLPCVVSSNVSREANLTNLVKFVSLNDDVSIWVEKILASCKQERIEKTKQLTDAGYSIKNTAKMISSIIEESLKQTDK